MKALNTRLFHRTNKHVEIEDLEMTAYDPTRSARAIAMQARREQDRRQRGW